MRLLSAIKPTGELTLGNYIGFIKNFKESQKKSDENIIFIADLHALTFPIDPKELYENTKKIAAFFLSIISDLDKTILFLQSDVSEHSELNSILQNFLYFGEMNRMTQFKSKAKLKNSLSLGFFNYPSLMCADILLYKADVIPVGIDQKQHIELARNLAKRFNSFYKDDILVLPKPKINKIGSKIMDLKNPKVKMSKSNSIQGTIFLTDSDENIRKKIMSAVTDSENVIKYDIKKKPGISNLLIIYSSLKKLKISDCEKFFKDYNYSDFKKAVADEVINELQGVKKKYFNILKNEKLIKDFLNKGAEKAKKIAEKTLRKVEKVVGFYGK